MPVLLRALILSIPEEKICCDWASVAQQLLSEASLNASEIGKNLDRIRDEWIASDKNSWLALHRFYPGVVERLRSLQLIQNPKCQNKCASFSNGGWFPDLLVFGTVANRSTRSHSSSYSRSLGTTAFS